MKGEKTRQKKDDYLLFSEDRQSSLIVRSIKNPGKPR